MAIAKRPGTLVLLRHGESTWNLENLFTGWTDVPLSERGVQEAIEAGRLMREAGLRPAVVHESLLLRAIQTTQRALAEMEMAWVPVKRTWRLNERHYGALQGLNKQQTAEKNGEDKVKLWRRSYDDRIRSSLARSDRAPRSRARRAVGPTARSYPTSVQWVRRERGRRSAMAGSGPPTAQDTPPRSGAPACRTAARRA